MKVHATPYSAGGIVLAGILMVIAALAWIASRGPGHTSTQFAVFTFLFFSVALYYADAMSESLSLKNGIVIFNSLLRPKRRINACAMSEVAVIHEGFNQEPGIVTAVFHGADGKITRLPLGPMWRQTELSAFFSGLEEATGECRLVEDAR
ncbi:hypothetical protein M0Q28_03210 [Patescibacteria group bacterium]|jgi:hypothetical protein|nr:hypothetical protein [Patescibacteria group bacterium]